MKDITGEKIREVRRSRGLRLVDVSDATGIPVSSLAALETGQLKGGGDPEVIIKVAEALGDMSIPLAYIESNPVYQYILPRVFPDLNNIRRDPAIIFTRLAAEADEAADASRILAEIYSNADPTRLPKFDETFRAKMEQILDIKRAVEILEFELLASRVVTREWLSDVYARQQQKCVDHGHHVPTDRDESEG